MKTRIVARLSAMDGRMIYWPEYFSIWRCLFFPVVWILAMYIICVTGDKWPNATAWVPVVVIELLLLLFAWDRLSWVTIYDKKWFEQPGFHYYDKWLAMEAIERFEQKN